jgi:hypothetical protein
VDGAIDLSVTAGSKYEVGFALLTSMEILPLINAPGSNLPEGSHGVNSRPERQRLNQWGKQSLKQFSACTPTDECGDRGLLLRLEEGGRL